MVQYSLPRMLGRLYVVSTPIGNLEDITLRALSTLKSVGLIAAEDTRRTGILLRHFGIRTPTTSLHEHNERRKLPELVEKLTVGTDVALVSDAGTPLVADPGQRLIAAAIEKGIRIVPIPGASALLSALVVSGFRVDAFVFGGFAPSRSKDRKKWLASFLQERRPIVFFETPHRISRMLEEAAIVFGDRPITISRELTKLHEEVIRTVASEAQHLALVLKGEFTVVVGQMPEKEPAPEAPCAQDLADILVQTTELDGASRRQALSQAARKFGLSTNEVYALLERLKTSSLP